MYKMFSLVFLCKYYYPISKETNVYSTNIPPPRRIEAEYDRVKPLSRHTEYSAPTGSAGQLNPAPLSTPGHSYKEPRQ